VLHGSGRDEDRYRCFQGRPGGHDDYRNHDDATISAAGTVNDGASRGGALWRRSQAGADSGRRGFKVCQVGFGS